MSSTTWFPPQDQQPLCVEINGTITLINNSSYIPNQGTASYMDTDNSDYRITYSVFNNESVATLEIHGDGSVVSGVTGDGGSVLHPGGGLLTVNGVHLNGSRVVPCPGAADGLSEITEDMKFTEEKFMSVIVYCCIFIVAAVGNLTVFITLFRNRSELFTTNISHEYSGIGESKWVASPSPMTNFFSISCSFLEDLFRPFLRVGTPTYEKHPFTHQYTVIFNSNLKRHCWPDNFL